MSDIMRPMAFEQLLNWILTEKKSGGTVFGEHHPYYADQKYNRTIFGRTLETPVGPAAGPTYPAGPEYCGGILSQGAVSLSLRPCRSWTERNCPHVLTSHASRPMMSATTVSGPRNFMFLRRWRNTSRPGSSAR